MLEKNKEYIYGHGSRKRASARVQLYKGSGKVLINNKEVSPDPVMIAPLVLAGVQDSFDVSARVVGGGMTGQKEAVRHGIARALIIHDPELRPTMRKAGFLTRDPREKERKKPGLKRARRAPQWQKR
jgi:small subunit ribosomal protein S9